MIYVEDDAVVGNSGQGPIWGAFVDGTIVAVDGTGNGCFTCPTEDTGFDWVPDTWHTIKQIIDVQSQSWRFFFDGTEYMAPDPLGFRGTPAQLDRIRYLSEVSGAGTYVDHVQVVVPEPSTVTMGAIAAFVFTLGRRRRADSR